MHYRVLQKTISPTDNKTINKTRKTSQPLYFSIKNGWGGGKEGDEI